MFNTTSKINITEKAGQGRNSDLSIYMNLTMCWPHNKESYLYYRYAHKIPIKYLGTLCYMFKISSNTRE